MPGASVCNGGCSAERPAALSDPAICLFKTRHRIATFKVRLSTKMPPSSPATNFPRLTAAPDYSATCSEHPPPIERANLLQASPNGGRSQVTDFAPAPVGYLGVRCVMRSARHPVTSARPRVMRSSACHEVVYLS